MTNDNKKRKITYTLMSLMLAAILCLSHISSVLASDYDNTSAGRSAQISILNLFDENGQIITDETGSINLELSIRSENIGIRSVNFTITSDGQSGQESVMVQTIETNGIKVQEPPVNWTVQEANAENIISLRRTVETYALQTLAVELGFTDINGNYYSEQYYGTVAPQILDIPQDIYNAQELETDCIAQEEYAVSEQTSETDAATGIEELTEAEVIAEKEETTEIEKTDETEVEILPEADPLIETELIPETGASAESEVKTEAEAITESEIITESESTSQEEYTAEPLVTEETEIVMSEPESESESVTELQSELEPEIIDETEFVPKSETETEAESELQTTIIPESSTQPETTAAAVYETESNIQYVYVPQYVYRPTTVSAGTYSTASSTRSQAVSSQNSSLSHPEKASVSETDDTLINDARSQAKKLEAEANSLEETTQESTSESKQPNKEGSTYDLSAIEGINGKSLKETGNIVIYEQNRDKLAEDSIKVTVSKNDETYELEKDTDYSVMLTGNSENKKIYKYTVNADTFKEDGRYKIFIYSEDESGNTNSNEIKDSSIEFSVDNTNPLIMDCSDPKAVNEGLSGEMIIKDNIQLEEVDIYVDDQKIDYDVDGETYSFSIPESEKEANVKVVAKDAAGNVYERTFNGYKAAGSAAVKSKSNAVFIIIAAVIFIAAAGILTVKIKAKRR